MIMASNENLGLMRTKSQTKSSTPEEGRAQVSQLSSRNGLDTQKVDSNSGYESIIAS